MDTGFRRSRSMNTSIENDPLLFLKNTRRSRSVGSRSTESGIRWRSVTTLGNTMPPKKKNSAFTFSPIKPKETEIIVQKPPNPSITSLQAINHTEGKKSFFTSGTMNLKSSINDDHPHRQAERLIFDVLQQLQTMYNNAVKTFSLTVIIKKTTFETIENGLQQAYKHIKQPCVVNIKTKSSVIENSIMNTLAQI